MLFDGSRHINRLAAYPGCCGSAARVNDTLRHHLDTVHNITLVGNARMPVCAFHYHLTLIVTAAALKSLVACFSE